MYKFKIKLKKSFEWGFNSGNNCGWVVSTLSSNNNRLEVPKIRVAGDPPNSFGPAFISKVNKYNKKFNQMKLLKKCHILFDWPVTQRPLSIVRGNFYDNQKFTNMFD
jgi:hypothetical protein